MKRFNNVLVITTAFAVSLIFGLTGPVTAFAQTSPSLGMASTYGVLAGSTYSNSWAATSINGDVGFTTGPSVKPSLGAQNTYYGSVAPYSQALTDASNALSNVSTGIASQPCTFTFTLVGGSVDLATDTSHPGTVGVYTPGVYCSTGAMDVGGNVTLNGSGTYIFRADGALTSDAGSVITLSNGASACNVFWTATAATTLAANTTFIGTDIDNNNAITVGDNTTWTGSAISLLNGTITTGDTDHIIVPTCSAPVTTSGGSSLGSSLNSVTIFKEVINDNGGTSTAANFPLFVSGTPVTSGNTVYLASGTYKVTETNNISKYKATFSGDCNANGQITVTAGSSHNYVCYLTNSDVALAVVPVPPLINVTKIPSPLALPSGPGTVTYNYTVSNVGIVPMTNVTVTDNECSPVTISGSINPNSTLGVGDKWSYSCTATLSKTTSDTVTATGKANGLIASDTANATVVVGSSVVPPLINLVKVPAPLFLPAGGGSVTYTYLVTNPGTVPLSNVTLVDNKCSQISSPTGDANSNGLLDPSETWTYSCQMNLSQTTTNTATAQGSANGFTVTHSSTVAVAVAAPKLPNTGYPPQSNETPWNVIALVGLLVLASVSSVVVIKKRKI